MLSPGTRGRVTLQSANPLALAAATPLTVTELMPESASTALPRSVMLPEVTVMALAGEVISRMGEAASCVELTTAPAAPKLLPSPARAR